jgi:hypothetical protein
VGEGVRVGGGVVWCWLELKSVRVCVFLSNFIPFISPHLISFFRLSSLVLFVIYLFASMLNGHTPKSDTTFWTHSFESVRTIASSGSAGKMSRCGSTAGSTGVIECT